MYELSSHEVAMSFEERNRLLVEWNDTSTPYPEDRCVHELIEAQVALAPQATAVQCGMGSLTYEELNTRANRLARHLRSLGVGPDRCVAICAERSLEMVVGLLAVLKAGGAYVPLDPGYPAARLSYMVANSSPIAILTHRAAMAVLNSVTELLPEVPPIVDLEMDAAVWEGQSPANLDPGTIGLTSRNLAYVIYTSGSTGNPKGVMTEHSPLVNRLCWMQYAYGLGPSDAVLQKTPFSFDVSVWEFLWAPMTGARLVMARPEGHKDPLYLRRIIQEQQITTVHFVPSMLQLFLCAPNVGVCTSLKRVICSGEALPASVLRRFGATLPRTRLYNLYGPTEAAIDVTSWAWESQPVAESHGPPIGRPISNIRIYILDGDGEVVPTGVNGEIHIGGVGVARGYLNRPQMTAERFVPNPFVPGDRLYKTGDLGRYRPDGNIEYLGRNDFQVKINGCRIELGEVESKLMQHPLVREAVVLACEDRAGGQRLVAYYTVSDGDGPAAEELKEYLSRALVNYMVPAAYVRLSSLPLTVNGKLDRNALLVPDEAAYDTRLRRRS